MVFPRNDVPICLFNSKWSVLKSFTKKVSKQIYQLVFVYLHTKNTLKIITTIIIPKEILDLRSNKRQNKEEFERKEGGYVCVGGDDAIIFQF